MAHTLRPLVTYCMWVCLFAYLNSFMSQIFFLILIPGFLPSYSSLWHFSPEHQEHQGPLLNSSACTAAQWGVLQLQRLLLLWVVQRSGLEASPKLKVKSEVFIPFNPPNEIKSILKINVWCWFCEEDNECKGIVHNSHTERFYINGESVYI